MKAWYFAQEDRKLRYKDNRPIIIGETHKVDCNPSLCNRGLHGSINIRDALGYAPGPILYLVDINGNIKFGDDKLCGRERTYLAGFDATDMLREAACVFALENIELIKPYTDKYDLIIEYLNTRDETKMAAARAAAEAAARAATRDAAEAAGAAAWAAARAAAWAAAEAAEWAAAEAADRAVEEAAERAAARKKQANILISLVYKYYPSIEEV